MKVQALTDAALARLQAMTWPPVYDGLPPATMPANGYAVLYGGAGAIERDRASDIGSMIRWTPRVVCAGKNPDQAGNIADHVRDQLIGWQPDPAGAVLTEVALDAPLLRDDSMPQDIRFSITLQFTTTTSRS